MGRFKTQNPMITTSVRVSPAFHKLATENGISFTESLTIGLSLKFADLGISDYDNNLNIVRKINLLREQLEKTSEELNKLKDAHKQENKEMQTV